MHPALAFAVRLGGAFVLALLVEALYFGGLNWREIAALTCFFAGGAYVLAGLRKRRRGGPPGS